MTTAATTRLPGISPVKWWTWFGLLWGGTIGKGVLSLVDQVVASGTRFVTTVIVGRACGADALGVYTLGFSIVIFVAVWQESLLTTPYAVLHSREKGRGRRQYAGSLLVHQGLLVMLAVTVLAAVATVLSSGIGPPAWAPLMWVLAALIPFSLLREFARRFAFAHLRVTTALIVDVAVALIQLSGLVLLAAFGVLSAGTALAVMGLACAVVGAAWLFLNRRNFVVRRQQVWQHLGRNWSFGKWVCGSQLIAVVSHSSIFWLLSILISTTATGVYAACSTVVLLANPFIFGVGNIVVPKTARAFAAGGQRDLRRMVHKVMLVLSAFLAVFWLAVFLWGEQIVAALYDDPAFANQGHIITILATSTFVMGLGIAYGHGLKAMGHPEWSFAGGILDMTAMLLTAVPLAWSFGIVGGASCLLCGSIAGTATRYVAFSLLNRRST